MLLALSFIVCLLNSLVSVTPISVCGNHIVRIIFTFGERLPQCKFPLCRPNSRVSCLLAGIGATPSSSSEMGGATCDLLTTSPLVSSFFSTAYLHGLTGFFRFLGVGALRFANMDDPNDCFLLFLGYLKIYFFHIVFYIFLFLFMLCFHFILLLTIMFILVFIFFHFLLTFLFLFSCF